MAETTKCGCGTCAPKKTVKEEIIATPKTPAKKK
jgi:hypothetical protein